MRKLTGIMFVGLLLTACGGDTASTDDGSTDQQVASESGALDPCTLAGDAVLTAYFGAPFDGEPGGAGPIDSCAWRDANANSLLVQVAVDFPLTVPDPCSGCVDLAFADDGYAAGSPIQSSATFVVGNEWYSVTTTGFVDDVDAIAALAETVFGNATG